MEIAKTSSYFYEAVISSTHGHALCGYYSSGSIQWAANGQGSTVTSNLFRDPPHQWVSLAYNRHQEIYIFKSGLRNYFKRRLFLPPAF